jgi:hypothetical protein
MVKPLPAVCASSYVGSAMLSQLRKPGRWLHKSVRPGRLRASPLQRGMIMGYLRELFDAIRWTDPASGIHEN